MKKPFYKNRKFWLGVAAVFTLLAVAGVFIYYKVVNTHIQTRNNDGYLYIKTGETYEDVLLQLTAKGFVKNEELFDFLAQRANLPAHIKPGKYKLDAGETYIDAILHLRSGRQEEVKVIINGLVGKIELARSVALKLNADSITIINMLEDSAFLAKNGLTTETALCFFVPNTYNFYWNTSAEQFMQRMKKEHDKFWNEERTQKAASQGLTPVQVYILASIVEGETNKVDEMGIVAGLYLNRLRKNMLLQSDPTVKFALKASGRQRIYTADTKFDSPYNTYLYTGLPPGPLALPSQQAMVAVLNASRHNYIYMCAKEDLSGYHNFTADYNQHQLNARLYQLELNKRGIK